MRLRFLRLEMIKIFKYTYYRVVEKFTLNFAINIEIKIIATFNRNILM